MRLCRNPQLHAYRSRDPNNCGEGRIAVLRQRFVEPFAGHTDFAGKAVHILCPRNIANGGAVEAAVAWVLVCARFQIQSHVFAGAQVLPDLPSREYFALLLSVAWPTVHRVRCRVAGWSCLRRTAQRLSLCRGGSTCGSRIRNESASRTGRHPLPSCLRYCRAKRFAGVRWSGLLRRGRASRANRA